MINCVELAEECKLEKFLAHAELFMIKHTDVSFWQEADVRTNRISQQCFLRVLQGAVTFRQETQSLLDAHSGESSSYCRACGHGRGYGGRCSCPSVVTTLKKQLEEKSVTIDTLLQWHRESW